MKYIFCTDPGLKAYNWIVRETMFIKKHPLERCQNDNIVVKNFHNIFRQSAQIRVSYYLAFCTFFYTKKCYGLKTKFGKIVFGPNNFFLSFELNSFNSISSS